MGELEGVRQQQKGDLFFSHSFGVSLTPSNQSAVVGGGDDDAYSNRGGSQERADCIPHFRFLAFWETFSICLREREQADAVAVIFAPTLTL